jgi:hypothetical protein
MVDQRLISTCVLLSLLAGCGSEEPLSEDTRGKRPPTGAPENTVGGFSIELPEETLQPGEEITPCYVFPLELAGPSRFVNAAVLSTEPGLHHGNITTRPKSGDGVRPCDEQTLDSNEGLDIASGGSVLFGSSTQLTGEEWRRFPSDMAYRIKDGYEIIARMHYLNTTPAVITVSPRYEWFTIPEAEVKRELGPIFWAISGWEIPPKTEFTVAADCQFYKPMQIVEAMPHMHKLGVHFGANIVGGPNDGEVFLDEKGYDPDGAIRLFEPPVDLEGSDGVHFSCTWNNTFDKTIVEGIGDNEMCMLFGYAYPAANAFSAFATDTGQCVELLAPDPSGG